MADMDQTDIDQLLAEAAAVTGEPVAATPEPTPEDEAVFELPAEDSTDQEQEAEIENSSLSDLMADLPQAPDDEVNSDTDESLEEVEISDEPTADSLAGNIIAQAEIDAMLQHATAFKEDPEDSAQVSIEFLLDMELTLSFEVGRSKMKINDLLSLGQGSVIELHRLVGEDLDLFVSGHLIAKGEVVVVNEKFGIRIISIIPPAQRIQNMAGMDAL